MRSSNVRKTTRPTTSLLDYYPETNFQQLLKKSNQNLKKMFHVRTSVKEESYLSSLQSTAVPPVANDFTVAYYDDRASGPGSSVEVAVVRLAPLKDPEVSYTSLHTLFNAAPARKSEFLRQWQRGSKNGKLNATLSSKNVDKLKLPSSSSINEEVGKDNKSAAIYEYIKASSFETDFKIRKCNKTPLHESNSNSSTSTFRSKVSTGSQTSRSSTKKPPWRPFGTQRPLFSPGNESEEESFASVAPGLSSSRASSSNKAKARSSTTSNGSRSSRMSTTNNAGKVDFVKHIFVINGRVLSYKGKGFESFSNWFGDAKVLEKYSKSKVYPKFQHEFNVSGFASSDIRLKLYNGFKLVVEAHKRRPGLSPNLRFKEVAFLPKDVPVESLIMCRAPGGRLIIQDAQSTLS